jgi:hypothetical protein
MALAASFLQAGDNRKARRHAEQSIAFYGRQCASRRILVEILMAQQAFEEALDQITRFAPPTSTPPWDHALSVRDWALCGAACAWRLRDWDEVARLIGEAYPDGPATMPALLLEDVFRLTLYRNQPDEAGRVAAILMGMNTLEFNDALLQTLVQQGWTNQALPLYRSAFTKDPRNALLRRRPGGPGHERQSHLTPPFPVGSFRTGRHPRPVFLCPSVIPERPFHFCKQRLKPLRGSTIQALE